MGPFKKLCAYAAITASLISIGLSAQSPNSSDQKVEQRLARIQQRMKAPSIKVLVLDDSEGALVEVKGGCDIFDPATGKKVSGNLSRSTFLMQPTRDGIKWGEEFPGIYQLLIVPNNSAATILVAGIEYQGWIYAYDVDGTLSIVNQVPIEDFVSSLLNGQVNEVQDQEAMAALAILARTDALYHTIHYKSPYWHIKGSDYGYHGRAVLKLDPKLNRALKATKGMVLSSGKLDSENINPIAVSWIADLAKDQINVPKVFSQAQKGDDAKDILKTLYPDSYLTLITNQKAK